MNKKYKKISRFSFIIILFIVSQVYAECSLQNTIETYKSNPEGLSTWLQENTVNSNCYVPIGKIYFDASLQEEDPEKKYDYLLSAKNYLKFAVDNIGKSDRAKYQLCVQLYVQSQCLLKNPDLDEILFYLKRAPFLKPFDNQAIKKNMERFVSALDNDSEDYRRLIEILGIPNSNVSQSTPIVPSTTTTRIPSTTTTTTIITPTTTTTTTTVLPFLRSEPKSTENTEQSLARQAFDSYEYFQAWEYYRQLYPNIIPDRLNDLIETPEITLVQNNIWSCIERVDKCRLKILSLIMGIMRLNHIPDDYFYNLFERNTGYPHFLSWHIAESSHHQNEKVSDRHFFSALHALYNLTEGFPTSDIFVLLLNSYRVLYTPDGVFNSRAAQRIDRKKNRAIYWIKKTWCRYDEASQNFIKSTYINHYPEIFYTFLLSVCQESETTSTSHIPTIERHNRNTQFSIRNPEDARAIAQRLINNPQNQRNHEEMIIFLNNLYGAYSSASNTTAINEYRNIYNNFIMNCSGCISTSIRDMFDSRFF